MLEQDTISKGQLYNNRNTIYIKFETLYLSFMTRNKPMRKSFTTKIKAYKK